MTHLARTSQPDRQQPSPAIFWLPCLPEEILLTVMVFVVRCLVQKRQASGGEAHNYQHPRIDTLLPSYRPAFALLAFLRALDDTAVVIASLASSVSLSSAVKIRFKFIQLDWTHSTSFIKYVESVPDTELLLRGSDPFGSPVSHRRCIRASLCRSERRRYRANVPLHQRNDDQWQPPCVDDSNFWPGAFIPRLASEAPSPGQGGRLASMAGQLYQ